ncbi:hypothetical protein SAMN05216439_1943 [Methanobrevibacter gottschalkii]|uniref:Uncharacterized protein n=1 Tax=Methanobrevibacter gottschalkii TaxID=190974 RepID=A0A1H7MFJ7_9EURY|nr:hypothetical protein [Methanobrevibacter gottschalkii]SEL09407.1 hypothetical protein SAMN05216439_1943 [Methanobrevibacter gottschalkii]
MNKKVVVAIVVVVIVAILAILMFIGSSNVTLMAGDSCITLPSDYMLDNKGIAYKNDIGIFFVSVSGNSPKDQKELFDAIKSNGKSSGYKNVTTDKVNGFKLYEYEANPDKLKNVSSDRKISGSYETWKTYSPYTPYEDVSDMDVTKFRYIAYVNENTDDISELYIFTNNTNVDLYSGEIAKIIDSIAVVEE